MARHYLDRLFAPNSIAVFGAGESPASVGGRIYMNLRDGGFPGALYPINPGHQRIFDRECHASIADIKAEIDLAIIVTPARTVPEIIKNCGERGIRMAVIISPGRGAGAAAPPAIPDADPRTEQPREQRLYEGEAHGPPLVDPPQGGGLPHLAVRGV